MRTLFKCLSHQKLSLFACMIVGFTATFVSPTAALAASAGKIEVRDSPFVVQTQLAATVMRLSRPIGILQVDVGALVANPAQRQRTDALKPVLRDAWRRTTQEFANRYYVPGRVPDAVLLGQRLQVTTDEVLGLGTARVLLTSLIVR